MQQNLNIKKQGLQLLVETYLKRRGPEDIRFMQKHLQTANHLASCVNSDIELGLSPTSLIENDQLYGSNLRRVPEDHQIQQFTRILKEELLRGKVLVLLLTILLQITCGQIWKCSDLRTGAIFILVLMILSLSLKIGLRWRSFAIISKDNFGKKPAQVTVIRDGQRFQISEHHIKVGDILFMDFNETIPVSGVLVSSSEITVDEEFIGRGIQRKVALEGCLKQIENKSDLQLKIDFENGTLPSPVLIRGSRASTGGTFKMLAIATEQESLLQNFFTSHNDSLSQQSILESWINSVSKDLKHVSQFCFLLLILFHVIGMIFKVLGLPAAHYQALLRCIIDGLHILVVGSFLLDASVLADLLKGEYLGVMALVGRGNELDRLLAVEQVLITDENICKYDQIIPKKVMLSDIHDPVELRLLPAMQDAVNYHILYEIMGGVQLDSSLPMRLPNKFHKNPIVHVNNSQEKIFSSLYEHCAPAAPLPHADENDSIAQLLRHNRHLHQMQTEKINKVGPEPEESLSESANGTLVRGQEDKSVKLSQYLGKHCQFSTQNIIEGLNKLAKNESRTYYFQKFSLERLSRVKFLWGHGKFATVRAQDQERLLQGIKKLQRENLTVYLIGLEEGAFSHQYMSFLFGAVGVQITHESGIINKLKNLERIGVNSLITIFKNSFDEMNQLQRHQYEYDFLKRGWMNENEHFCKLQQIKRAGGRPICSNCLLSSCNCRPKELELANVQGFLNAIEEVKCIYNLTEDDIEYIELGFEQLNTSTLRIVDRKEDSMGRLNQIIAGHQLVNTLEENLSFWVLLQLLAFFYYFPLNFVTFGNVFCKQQLYFYFIYIQLLLARHHFIRNTEEVLVEKREGNRRNKNLFGWAIKGDLLIFLLLVIVSCVVILFFPHLFVTEDHELAESQHCISPKSFYHNPDIKVYLCHEKGHTIYYYSKLQTFIFLVTLLAITFKTFLSSSKMFAILNLVFYSGLLGVLMAFLYLFPSLLHLSHHGLSSIELSMAFLMSFLIVFLSRFNRWIIGTLEGGKRFQLTLNISLTKRYNQYAEILREFKEGKTLKYPYEEHQ